MNVPTDPGYHSLKISDTWIVPGTYDVQRLWDQCGFGDVAGLSVLDLGCHCGGYSLEALHRGASRVMALDSDINAVNIANTCFEAAGFSSKASAWRCDIDGLTDLGGEKFDVVLGLSIFHHLHRPLDFLRLVSNTLSIKALLEIEHWSEGRTALHEVPEYVEELALPDFNRGGFLTHKAITSALEFCNLKIWSITPGRRPCRIVLSCSKK